MDLNIGTPWHKDNKWIIPEESMAYISPLELTIRRISEELIEKQEGQVIEAIYQQGIKVDKEELIKALNYDRHQYEQGFRDGQKSMKEALKRQFEELHLHPELIELIDNAQTGEEDPK